MILYPLLKKEGKLELNVFFQFSSLCFSTHWTLHCDKVKLSFKESITGTWICLTENKFRYLRYFTGDTDAKKESLEQSMAWKHQFTPIVTFISQKDNDAMG